MPVAWPIFCVDGSDVIVVRTLDHVWSELEPWEAGRVHDGEMFDAEGHRVELVAREQPTGRFRHRLFGPSLTLEISVEDDNARDVEELTRVLRQWLRARGSDVTGLDAASLAELVALATRQVARGTETGD